MPVALGPHRALPDRLRARTPGAGRVFLFAEDRDLSRRQPRMPQGGVRDEPAEPGADDGAARLHCELLYAAGAISSMLEPNCRSCVKIATVIGCVSRASVSATSRSFHVQRNWKIASEAIAGRPSGRIRRTKIHSSFAPSMRADSRMSFGIPMKKLRSRKIAKGSPKAVWKRITLRVVPPIPRVV